ncbi:hypothetical protein BJX64DRAFT_116429 [Aspergillus heterothallicus]
MVQRWRMNDKLKKQLGHSLTIKMVRKRPKVFGAPLVLDFEEVFLRAPTTPKEYRNVVLGEQELAIFARHVLEEQRFM